MIFKKITSNTPSKRNLIQLKNFNNLIKSPLLKTKFFYKSKKSGRNNQGKITISHKGKGHKKRYRKIDFTRIEQSTDIVLSIEYDPNRTSFISSLYSLKDQTFKYILTPKNLKPGNLVKSGPYIHEYKIGYSLPLQNLPVGSIVHNVSTKINAVGKINRAAGTYAKIIKKNLNYAVIQLSSGKFKKLPIKCFATIGIVSNNYNFLKTFGKAGRSRWLNIRPTVRGVAMNPVDHPNGGGEGKTSSKKLSPWGK